jgi:hypothetical protein
MIWKAPLQIKQKSWQKGSGENKGTTQSKTAQKNMGTVKGSSAMLAEFQ